MKRFIAMILAVLLVFSMAACGKDTLDTPISGDHETKGNETTDSTTEATECPHNFVADKTEDPTCEKEGYTLYICYLCKATEQRNKTEKLEHVYASRVTPPTTTEKGYTTHTCEVCGHSYEDSYTDVLPENGTAPVEHTHEFKDTVKAPTCTTEGYTTHKCSCGEAYNDTKVPATGHKYADTVVNPTCTAEGYTSHECSQCKSVYKDSATKALGHNYTSKVVDPTRDAQGYTEHTCTRCGDSYQDNYKEPLGIFEKPTEHTHSYTETVTAATCTTEGYTTHICACGDSYVDNKTPVAAHQYQDTVTSATCTAEGYTTHKCKVCGSAYTDSRVAALGHQYTDTVVKPTCEEKGYTQHTCYRCGNTTKDTYTNATGHAATITYDTATCTEDGTISGVCDNCGGFYTTPSPAKGHGETYTLVIEVTCRREGYFGIICYDCQTVVSSYTTPPTGTCNYVTDTAGKVGNDFIDKYDVDFSKNAWISGWNDSVLVDACYGCGDVKNPRIAYDGASEMLGYVNELRRSVGVDYGVDLELDSACVALAQLRAKEVYNNSSNAGARTPSGFTSSNENCLATGTASVYRHYTEWLNSSAHYSVMTDIGWTHFGYGAYLPSDAIERGSNRVTAVQIFAW